MLNSDCNRNGNEELDPAGRKAWLGFFMTSAAKKKTIRAGDLHKALGISPQSAWWYRTHGLLPKVQVCGPSRDAFYLRRDLVRMCIESLAKRRHELRLQTRKFLKLKKEVLTNV